MIIEMIFVGFMGFMIGMAVNEPPKKKLETYYVSIEREPQLNAFIKVIHAIEEPVVPTRKRDILKK